jgi:phage shock protein E
MNNYFNYLAFALIAFLIIRRFLNNKSVANNIKTLAATGKKIFLVDVRQPDEFKAGSVIGALNIPLGNIQSRLNDFKGKEHIVVFCRSGARAGQAARILAKNGIENISNGGNWQQVASALK